MGAATAGEVATKLMRHGRMPDTPVLVIENGTRPDAKHTPAALATLEATLAANPPKGPVLLIIGEVASLYQAGELAKTAMELPA
ncbi:MAG: hypothetical protein WDN06_16570 [Asticcacaulis sp.]